MRQKKNRFCVKAIGKIHKNIKEKLNNSNNLSPNDNNKANNYYCMKYSNFISEKLVNILNPNVKVTFKTYNNSIKAINILN